MNKWLYRAVGAVSVASGALLLSNGVAHAQAANDARPDLDPQAMRGLVAEFFTPMWQQREEFIGGLLGGGSPLGGPTGGGGAGGLLGGLTGGNGLTGITGVLTGKGDGGPLSSLTGGQGLSGLTGGLTGKGADGDSPLSGITGSLTGSLTGGGDGPLDGPFGGLNNLTGLTDLAGTEQRNPIDPAALRDVIGDTSGIATDGPASTDIVSPSLRGTSLDTTAQRPIQLNPDVARQVNHATSPMVQALIADAVAKRMGVGASSPEFTTESAPVEENLPLLGSLPGGSAIMGPEGPLKDLHVVGNFANGIPVVGQVLNGELDPASVTKLPVVNQLLTRGVLNTGESGLPIVGSIPFVGQALNSLSKQTMGATDGIWQQNPLGDLLKAPGSNNGSTPGSNNGAVQRPAPTPSQSGSRGPAGATPSSALPPGGFAPSGVTPSATLPGSAMPSLLPASAPHPAAAAAPVPRPARTQPQAAQSPVHVGRHRATDRPEVADPELEAAPAPGSLPLFGSLTDVAGAMGGGVGTLPLSTLVRNMPLVSDVPLVGELGTPLKVLRALPLVGSITGLVPVESDTAA